MEEKEIELVDVEQETGNTDPQVDEKPKKQKGGKKKKVKEDAEEVTEQPTTEETPAETPTEETPAETPTEETPAETPTEEAPATEQPETEEIPTTEEAPAETPTEEAPAVEETPDETKVEKSSTKRKPVPTLKELRNIRKYSESIFTFDDGFACVATSQRVADLKHSSWMSGE